ncbi:MAG: DUF4032 domain-containing protein, partial [Nocardioidaceae bacterium]
RGISRHVVRFVRVGPDIYAAKEVLEHLALHEYRLLRDLSRLDTPSVEPLGVVTGRIDVNGDPLDPILLTRHLQFSLPYRSLFTRGVRQDTVNRLVDAMVVLLARLHLVGFFWGDCSLSNTLFRRAAGEFAAYLVDAETGELHDQLSGGQRAHDLDTAVGNLFGELLDLQAGGFFDEDLDDHAIVERFQSRYEALWSELTGIEDFNTAEMWRLGQRIERLNELGFDVDELDIITDWNGESVQIQPKSVEPGHHCRRLQSLTGMDVEDNQARRLLNDLDAYAAANGLQAEDPAMVAHRWLTQIFEPIVAMAPPERRSVLEPAEMFHEILEHRWYLSEQAGHEIEVFEAARDYFDKEPVPPPDDAVTTLADELSPETPASQR